MRLPPAKWLLTPSSTSFSCSSTNPSRSDSEKPRRTYRKGWSTSQPLSVSTAPPWRSSRGGDPHLVSQHQFHIEESPAASLLSTKAEESPSPTPHPHHILQRDLTISDRKNLQQILRTAVKIIGVSLPSITNIYSTRCMSKAICIANDPSHQLFTLLLSGRRYRSIKALTVRLRDSFFLKPSDSSTPCDWPDNYTPTHPSTFT